MAVFLARLKISDADAAIRVEAEDFVEREDDCRSSRDNRAADDGHFSLVHVAAPDGEAAVDNRRNAEHETEHHDYGKAVTNAGLEVGRTETCTARLREGGQGVEDENRGHRKDRRKPRANFECESIC